MCEEEEEEAGVGAAGDGGGAAEAAAGSGGAIAAPSIMVGSQCNPHLQVLQLALGEESEFLKEDSIENNKEIFF